MKRPPRPVVVVAVRGLSARLSLAMNGSAYSLGDVVNLATDAGLEPRRVRGGVLVGVSGLRRLEELARIRGVILQRTKSSTTETVPAFQPPARIGIDDGPEPLHGCARRECRVPGCRHGRDDDGQRIVGHRRSA